MRGHLYFKYGCMSSGKSLQLLAMAHNFQEHKIPFILIKPEIDNRDGSNVIHSRALGDKECITISTTDNLFDIISVYIEHDTVLGGEGLKWILVDEAQFLTPKQVDDLGSVADILCINVICYGLRTDFQTNLFPGSKRLFEIADSIEEIKSSCFCNHKTVFNARVDENKDIVIDGDQVEIGGDEKYVALCRKCFFEKLQKKL